ncbi:MAG: complex I subunit 4 family protein [Candidatus Dormibacteraceae bacterium]
MGAGQLAAAAGHAPWLASHLLAGIRSVPSPSIPILPSPAASPAPLTGSVVSFSFLLSALIWTPVVVAGVMALMPDPRRRWGTQFRLAAFWTEILVLVLVVVAYAQYQTFSNTLQFGEKVSWLPAIGAGYHLGLDGVNLAMLLLSAIVGVVAVLASGGVHDREGTYFTLLLLGQSAVNGVICSQDLLLMVLFWGAAVIPIALLIRGWGGARRVAAAWRFLAYGLVGVAALWAAAIMLYQAAGGTTFDLPTLLLAQLPKGSQIAIGLALLVAAACWLPLFPLHGWVRDVLAEAPAGVAVQIAGVGTRLGGYLLIRILVGGEHDAARFLAPLIGGMGVATVIWGAMAAYGATDLRRMGAYASMVPAGVVALGVAGLTPLALDAAVLALFAGGLGAALLNGACATVAERAQSRSLALLGGLGPRMPHLAWLLVLGAFAVIGVPGLATFTADLFAFMGSMRTAPEAAFGVAAGLVLAALAVAALLFRVLFSAPNDDAPGARDASLAEVWYLGILAGALLWVGIIPGGPKLSGVAVFDPGLVNVINSSAASIAAPYVPGAPSGPLLGTGTG